MTLVFCDIEGSTRLLQRLGQDYAQLLAKLRSQLHAALQRWGGSEVDTQGDAIFASFPRALDAINFAVDVQQWLANQSWPQSETVRIRMGLHTGEPLVAQTGYVGMDVHRAARICQAGHGGQVLLSEATAVLARDRLPAGLALRDLGKHRLKSIDAPEHLYQLLIPGLQMDYPPLRSLNICPNNLPARPASLFGRQAESAAIKSLLLDPQVRLLTLIGTGGIGKTSLALQVAAELCASADERDTFSDGVYFIPLAPINDPNLVLPTIASTLNIREGDGLPLQENLYNRLATLTILLLLDNFEHLMAAAREAAQLLERCPHLKLLATSREALHLRGEHEFPLAPLALPDASQAAQSGLLSSNPAVALFVQRAQAVKPDFHLTPDNAQPVAEICAYLDGLPLAIELAAARVKMFPPPALVRRLRQAGDGSAFRLLSGGPSDAPERQRTLHAAMEWSYSLLKAEEQKLFRSLAVFAGGFTLLAVEAVCCARPSGDERSLEPGLDALEGVASLLDKSLLRLERGDELDTRYAMLELIRQYARGKLAEYGEETALVARHAAYFLDLALQAEPMLSGRDQKTWFKRLESEHNNLRAALEWHLINEQGGEASLRMASALIQFWDTHGYISEGWSWLLRALGLQVPSEYGGQFTADLLESLRAQSQSAATTAWVDALFGIGLFATRLGHLSEGVTGMQISLSVARRLNYKAGLARALQWQAMLMINFQEAVAEQTTATLKESLALWQETNNPRGAAQTIGMLANLAAESHDLQGATDLFEEGLAIFRAIEDQREIAGALWNLGQMALRKHDYPKARSFFTESETLYQELQDQHGVATQHRSLAELERLEGKSGAAIELFEGSLSEFRSIHDKSCLTQALIGLGKSIFDQPEGETGRAGECFQESALACRELKYHKGEIECLCWLADTWLRRGEFALASQNLTQNLELLQGAHLPDQQAAWLAVAARWALCLERAKLSARLLGARDQFAKGGLYPLSLAETVGLEGLRAGLMQRLGEEAFAAEIQAGRGLTFAEAAQSAGLAARLNGELVET